ncbi:unnamed protein product [Vitrella brassicaformis CCMP3155]|uniref:Sm domain-containing protein n=1 Tax=Vitrella brassicaformis (strain CCMP3155) TaxID=1169540 RepID=A0A0G4F8Y5_VITBC|nr:unnamed protein product [Vitrella brassicaformis CCMP3155]|mmetsp:Transcript_48619/g.121733  ORF Transcript_48619/g.121733 Transcript_48619/m.121733 type:complete len:102 (-) Transcript_48619:366-671(-)|eukprot:CEM09159.1 unnamed protein product [Vitrella brassicaformis CCMP3155]
MSKREGQKTIFEFNRYLNKRVRVKFNGGREVTGILKGHDQVCNLVLDDTEEYRRDPDDPFKLLNETRQLGLVVARGTAVMLVSPVEGMEEISNPFVNVAES